MICERAPIHCLCWVLESPIPPILPIMFTLLCGQCFQFQAFQFPLQSHRLLHSLHPHLPPPSPPALFSKSHNNNPFSSIELPPNALRRKLDPHWRGGFSLGVDLGTSRTGLALSKGFSIRPLTVIFFFILPFMHFSLPTILTTFIILPLHSFLHIFIFSSILPFFFFFFNSIMIHVLIQFHFFNCL